MKWSEAGNAVGTDRVCVEWVYDGEGMEVKRREGEMLPDREQISNSAMIVEGRRELTNCCTRSTPHSLIVLR